MRVLIDTNVLISAALNANGIPFQAYVKAASYPNHGLICEQNADEMKRIFKLKLRRAGNHLTGFRLRIFTPAQPHFSAYACVSSLGYNSLCRRFGSLGVFLPIK